MDEINNETIEKINNDMMQEVMEVQKKRRKKLYKRGIKISLFCGAVGLAIWSGVMIQREFPTAAEAFLMEKEKLPEETEEVPELFAMQAPDGMWGYINRAGEVMIYPQFDTAENFSVGGLALVQKNGEWGYIDQTGTFIIGPGNSDEFYTADKIKSIYANPAAKWDKQMPLLPFRVCNKWGFVTTKGEVVIPFLYEAAQPFSQERALVFNDGYYGFIDETGSEVIPLIYDYASSFNREGLAIAAKEAYYGMIDIHGNEVVPFQYFNIGAEDESGMIAVQDMDQFLWGYINEKGEEVIPCLYDDAGIFYDGEYAEVMKDGLTGLIDKQGKIVFLGEEGVFITENHSPYFIIGNYEDLRSIIDVREEITKLKWYDYIYIYGDDLDIAEVGLDGKAGLISLQSDWETEITYDYIQYSEDDQNVIFEKKGLYGSMKLLGKEIIPPIYDDLYFLNDYYYAKKDGKGGVLSQDQEIVVPFEYDIIVPLRQLDEKLGNMIMVGVENKFGLMDSSFQMIQELQEVDPDQKIYQEIFSHYNYEVTSMVEYFLDDYKYAKEFFLYLFAYLRPIDGDQIERLFGGDAYYGEGYYFYELDEEGYCIVEQDCLYGIADSQHNIVVEPIYSGIHLFNEKTYLITLDDKYGLMDLTGNILIEPICSDISYIDGLNEWGVYSVESNNGFAYYNYEGECVLSFLEPANNEK